jgi:uncharacterized protein YfaS (alpha-2-macroglobulin family)
MRRFSLVLLTLLILLSVSLLAAQEQPTLSPPSSSPLTVIETSPFIGQEIGLDQPIQIYFDRPLDCASLSAGDVNMLPADGVAPIQTNVTCGEDGQSLVLTPAQPLGRAQSLNLTINPAAVRGVDGAQLAEPFTLGLTTVGYLKVSDTIPADGSVDVAPDSTITIIFNRPVVPLTPIEGASPPPSPITIVPEVAGQGQWVNTSIYMFRPDVALSGGTTYTVSAVPDLQALDGAVLEFPLAWSFNTAQPQIVEVFPTDLSSDIPLEQMLQVKFNQPMDRASAEANFYLRASGQTESVSGTFEWAEDSAGFSFTPDELLAIDTIYDAGFPANTVTTAAGGGTLPAFRWTFATVPFPTIISTDPADGMTDVYPYGTFTIYFASPMNVDTLKDKVLIEPEPWRDPDFYYNDYANSYTVNYPVEPSTTYTVTILPGMEDAYGNAIQSERIVTFTTRAYDPDFILNTPGEVGFYNAEAENTQLFLTHRNISRLDLNLYSIPLAEFARALGQNPYSPSQSLITGGMQPMRSWQMPVTAPENVRKYELLVLGGEGGSAVDCPGAPATRLKVGDMAVVISDPDPVRARSSPPDGEVVGQLYRDYSLPIIGGPVCANDILWWEVRLRDETTAWVAEGVGDEYYLDVRIPAQTTEVTVAPVVGGEGALSPGVYLLDMSSLETIEMGYGQTRHFLIVGTANLSMKFAVDHVLVWATNVDTGLSIIGAPITLYDADYNVLGTGITDADGMVRIAIPRVNDLYQSVIAVMQTDTQFGMGFSGWSDGIEPYQFGQSFNYYPQQYSAYVYTDRPIYRPDQPVYFRGIIRSQNDVTYTLPDFNSLPVRIYDSNGEIIFDESLPLTAFGTFNGQFNIADDAPLGYYRIEVVLPTSDPDAYYFSNPGISFGVAEYRLPEYQVTVTPEAVEVAQGDTITVTVDSKYFFGGAVSNANVDYSVVAQPYFFEYDGPGFYSFQDFNYDEGPSAFFGGGGGQIASGSGTTDGQGILTIEVPAELEDATRSQTFTIEATVTDESGLVVAGRTDVIVHKGLIYIGVRPENYVSTAGRETTVNLIAVDWESEGIPNQPIDVEVVERRWSSVQEQDEAGRATWAWEVEEIPVTTGSVTTGEDGRADFTFTPPNGGIFKVRITTRDSAGNQIVASTDLWVSSEEYVGWRQQNSNRIDLVADQDDYTVGDTAQILIASPWQGTAEALVTVERGGVLRSERITLTSNSTIYELPITADFAPNVYVSVLLVKGVDANNPVPAFRAGLAQLGVDNAQKELTVEITPDQEQAGPRETVTYTVTVTDYQGNPVQAEVGVGLTDLASLSIAEPNSGPLLNYFYGQQGLAVRTSTPLTINVDALTQYVLDVIKGGGGGGGEGGIFDIRQDFVDTAYWNPSVITGADGTATFEVTLPDNLTTWRLDARAVTDGADGLTLVGQGTFDLLSTKPLLIRPVTPRFLVIGDQVTLAAIVNNNTGEDMPVEVFVEGTGLTFSGDINQTFTIPTGGRQRVEWTGTVEDVTNIDLTFFANGNNGAYTDASKPPLGQGDNQLLPVYKYEAPETVGTGGLLREAGSVTEVITLPDAFDITQGEVSIKLDPSLAATTVDGLEYLKNFPHQCIEQTVSKFLPNIMTFRALESLNVADEELRVQLQSAVNFALQRLYAQQHADGGWGWFVNSESNALTTAYALIGLAEARNQGFVVSDSVIRNAQTFLQNSFIVPGADQPTWRLNRQAFVLYALARSGAADVARTSTLFDSRERLSLYAKAFLALTFNIINPSDTSRSDTLISDLTNSAIVSATGTHWEEAENDFWNWNTDTRSTAIILDALVKLAPQSNLTPNVVRWLMVARTADAWETTQETAWAVMSLTDWMLLTGELQPDYQYSASLNGDLLIEGAATTDNVRDSVELQVQVSDLLVDEANQLVIGRTEGQGVLYYTAHLSAFLPVPEIEPLNRGIILERRYTMPDSDTPVTEARVGELIQVRLTIIAPNDLYYAVIEDPIPAGTEGVNPELSTEQQIGTRPGLVSNDPLSYGWGWWWFSNTEFRDDRVVLYADYLPAGTYEYQYSIRAGLPGTYNVIPPTGYQFYFPEVYGRGAGSTFNVLPAAE